MPTDVPTSAAASEPGVTSTDDALKPGQALGEYVIRGKLGEGGCGVVYRAEHSTSSKPVAIKVIHVGQLFTTELVQRFVREARTTQMIQHPGIVEVLELNTAGYLPYIVMELLEGQTLSQMIKDKGAFRPAEAYPLLLEVLSPLEAAHAVGVVHRDIKPSNILLARDADGPPRVKLLDFGIAKLLRPEAGDVQLTTAGSRLGSAVAMAPEQLRGEVVDERADIYAMGVLIFYLLAGRPPFQGRTMGEYERNHLVTPTPKLSQFAPVPPAWDEVVRRCMEKEREQRYASVAELRAALVKLKPAEGAATANEPAPAMGTAFLARISVDDSAASEDTYEEAAAALEMIQTHLESAGLRLTLQTPDQVLATRVLTGEAAVDRAARRRFAELGASVWQELEPIRQRNPALRIRLRLHSAACLTREEEVVGGSLLDVDAWEVEDSGTGPSATSALVEGFAETCVGWMTVIDAAEV